MAELGFLAVGRPTFDVEQARELARQALVRLRGVTGVAGTEVLASTVTEVEAASKELMAASPEAVVVFQATFSDASMVRRLSQLIPVPVVVWAVPDDPPAGDAVDRLRLNSFCGANLAAYTLNRWRHPYAGVLVPVDETGVLQVVRLTRALAAAHALKHLKVLRVGKPPVGFYPSEVNPDDLVREFGVSIAEVSLDEVFNRANRLPEERVRKHLEQATHLVEGLQAIPPEHAAQSARAYLAITDLIREQNAVMAALECWPDFMVRFGGAACWAVSRLIDEGIVAACETDVYGAITMFLQHRITESSPFFADLVRVDVEENTGTFWHCGAAAVSLARGGKARASVQPNRKVGLTVDFALRSGEATIAKLSQGPDGLRLFLTHGEILDRPLQYRGNTAVVRFPFPVSRLVDLVFDEGLDHHYAVCYGDIRRALRVAAHWLQVKVVEVG